MAIELNETDEGKVLEVRVSGKLAHADYEHFVPKVEELIAKHGKIDLLFEMIDFHGWELAAVWDDIKFDIQHFADIERLAMVGDKKWEKGMSKFCAPFTRAKVRYFDRPAIDEARIWVRGG